ATLGGLTLRARDAYEVGLCPEPVCPEGWIYPQAEEERFHGLRGATNVMVGVSAGVAVVTAALGIVLARRHAADKKKGRARGRVRLGAPTLVVVFWSAALSRRSAGEALHLHPPVGADHLADGHRRPDVVALQRLAREDQVGDEAVG